MCVLSLHLYWHSNFFKVETTHELALLIYSYFDEINTEQLRGLLRELGNRYSFIRISLIVRLIQMK